MLMQTDNEDDHRRSRASIAGDRQATGERGGGSPAWGTLSPLGLPCPEASGSPIDPRSGSTPPALPTLPSCPSGRPPASVSGASSRLPLSQHRTGAQRIQDNNEATEVPTNTWTDTWKCGPAGRQLRHRPNTQGRALGGAQPEPRPPLRPKGLRGRKAGPGRAGSRGRDRGGEDGAGGWWRVTPQASHRRPAAPGDGCSHLRNSVWPAWW